VLQFEYKNLRINLLDTPGHQDFSEDTYRTLMAADAAVMVIDSAKGVEPQTVKLFDVCRMRGIPIFTFFNKMDREGRDPFEFGARNRKRAEDFVQPGHLAVGMGDRFRGVYHRLTNEFHLFRPALKPGQWPSKNASCAPRTTNACWNSSSPNNKKNCAKNSRSCRRHRGLRP